MTVAPEPCANDVMLIFDSVFCVLLASDTDVAVIISGVKCSSKSVCCFKLSSGVSISVLFFSTIGVGTFSLGIDGKGMNSEVNGSLCIGGGMVGGAIGG